MQSLQQTLRLYALGTLLLPLLAGCGGGGGGNGNTGGGTTGTTGTTGNTGTTGTTGTTGNTGNNNGGNGSQSVSVTEPNGLTASISENSSTVSVGGSITYTLTLTNNTGAAILTNAYSSQSLPANFRVVNQSGTIVFNPIPYTPQINTISVASGQSLTASQVVSSFAASGTYTATAAFADTLSNISVGPLTVQVQ